MNPSIRTAQVLPARAVLFLGIVAFHVVLAYVFASGLIASTVHILRPDNIEIIDVPQKPTPNVQLPPASTSPPLLTTKIAPLPDLPVINMESDTTITLPGEPVAGVGPTMTMPEPAPLPLRLVGRNVMPNTADYYPPADIREGNEGTAEVRSCVSASGKLDGTPTVEATSGRGSLDKAAVRLARDGKYARAVRGDTPVPNCYRFRVTFTLH
ncbi:MAG: TonB family protein [Gammaproteobacteria bacterium]